MARASLGGGGGGKDCPHSTEKLALNISIKHHGCLLIHEKTPGSDNKYGQVPVEP